MSENVFPSTWTCEILAAPPLIAPARQYTWPHAIAGEEDALARGAVRVMVRPRTGGAYLLTCALGFRDPTMPTGVFACPHPDWLCVLAGGYAYLASTLTPGQVTLLAIKPVVEVRAAAAQGLLLFVGFATILAWGADGLAWETARLSWEGLRVVSIADGECLGFGWDLMADHEVEFRIDLRTGTHTGGGYRK